MTARRLPLAVGCALFALFAVLQFLFIVREGELAVITRMGRPHRTIKEAGLQTRLPWPLERVHRFDGRIHTLRSAYEETLTADGKNILMSMYCGWRIRDPLLFLERLGSVEQAEASLDGLIRTYKSAAVGKALFSELVNTAEERLVHDQIEREVLAAVRSEADRRYGIEVCFVGIRRLGLPDSILQSVYERMRAERKELAEQYRSEGEAEAIRIRARADSERAQFLARAEADARRIRAEAEAEAAKSYRIFAENLELALWLRKLDALRETVGERATLVLGADVEPFDLLLPTPNTPPGNTSSKTIPDP